MTIRAKDFIETDEGLLFAVVVNGYEAGRVLCFLRYARVDGAWRKLPTDSANALLRDNYPHYLHHSEVIDAALHAVPRERIVCHYHPSEALQRLLREPAQDAVVGDLQKLCALLRDGGIDLDHFGVTGSLLPGLQNHASDIDLVCYQRDSFHRARNLVQALIAQDRCQALNDDDWLSAYQRRACDFALDEYIWHEQRKYNKAIINQRKFDLSLLVAEAEPAGQSYRKLGFKQIEARVVDDHYGYDYPARFELDHPEVSTAVCFTATYTGQAQTGERVIIAGQVEIEEQGLKRIVVGSSREAIGEFIRVLR